MLGFLQRPDVQEKAEEVARLFYSNGSVTINLLPILLFSFLGALCELQIIYGCQSPTRTFSLLKVLISAFYLNNLLRHYYKWEFKQVLSTKIGML